MLSTKLAVITGSASGIGLSTAKLFLKNGANLALVDFSKTIDNIAKELEADAKLYQVKVSSHICDVSKSDQVNKLFNDINDVHTSFKAPNVIVNSAGIVRDAFLVKMTEEQFDQVISTNLKGYLNYKLKLKSIKIIYFENRHSFSKNYLKKFW
jgi:3-oxoacyl-[acyl-carrier protein] reductase